MNITRLDGHLFKRLVDSGSLEVGEHKSYMNAINVFPIADGDTGTNLSKTLKAMTEKVQSTDSFSDTAASISKMGLANARGNSGIIFVSYMNGLAIESADHETVGIEEFAHMANGAVAYAYQSIENPVEGTMISVIRDWASYLISHYMHFDTFDALLLEAYAIAEKSLEKTTEMLEILKKHKVVDAGAAGFVGFLRGINAFFSNQPLSIIAGLKAPKIVMQEETESTFRYCTEAYLEQVTISATDLKMKLRHLGDSLIVTRMGDHMRIHIHTDQPEVLFQTIIPYGAVTEQKVDDMTLQKLVRSGPLGPVVILTDSIADLPDTLKLQYHIHTMPLSLMVNDVDYLDKQTITLNSVFDAMVKGVVYPTSTLPSPGRIEEKLNYLLENYEKILIISVSGKLSGTYSAFMKMAQQLDPKGERIEVIDSLLNSGAQGLVVKKAAELMAQKIDAHMIVEHIKAMIPKVKIYVCLESVKYAIKSGRVPKTIGRVAMTLGARPIMTLDSEGKGAAFGVGFSKRQMTAQIMRIATKVQKNQGIEAYSIVHAGNPTYAKHYELLLTALTGKAPEFVTEISSVTAIHSGIGSVALSIIEK